MSKTFKSALDSLATLEVEKETYGPGIYLTVSQSTILLAQSDAPALALAILEAAGYEGASSGGVISGARMAVGQLRGHVEVVAKRTAEAEAQAKLEAEALELANSAVLVVGNPPYPSIGHMSDTSLRKWLAVARRARELAKEVNNGR